MHNNCLQYFPRLKTRAILLINNEFSTGFPVERHPQQFDVDEI